MPFSEMIQSLYKSKYLKNTTQLNINSNSSNYGSITIESPVEPEIISETNQVEEISQNRKEALWDIGKNGIKFIGLVYITQMGITFCDSFLINPEEQSNFWLLAYNTAKYGLIVAIGQYSIEDYIFGTLHDIKQSFKQLWTGKKVLSEETTASKNIEELKKMLLEQGNEIKMLWEENQQMRTVLQNFIANNQQNKVLAITKEHGEERLGNIWENNRRLKKIPSANESTSSCISTDLERDDQECLIEENTSGYSTEIQNSDTINQEILFSLPCQEKESEVFISS